MTLPEAASSASGACFHKGCSHTASATCQRCGHSYCAAHLQVVTLERRVDEGQGVIRQHPLARLPTSKTTYILCSACRNKPLHERLLHPDAPTN